MFSNKRINILYIDGVGPFGGASRSLFELISSLAGGEKVKPYFIAANGTALDFYSRVTDEIISTRGLTRFDHTRYSHYRGIRWLVLLREIFHIPYMLLALYKAWKKWKGKIDIIHSNEITELIPAILCKMLFKAPLVVHVRSVQNNNPGLLRTRLIQAAMRKYVDQVVVIDQTARKSLPHDIKINVIHNSFSAPPVTNPASDSELGILNPTSLKIGFVGNLQVAKGVFDLIRAAALVRASVGNAVEFIFVGGRTHAHGGVKNRILSLLGLRQDISQSVDELVQSLNCADTVHFTGAKLDIQRFYSRFDVLAFPSHFDAPGRPVFEAAFYSVPCLVCVDEPERDTVIPEVTGLCIPAENPEALAGAILYYLHNPDKRLEMGKAAYDLALENFFPQSNADKMLSIYSSLI